MQLMKRLWTEENVTHKGKFFNVQNLTLGPRPIQKPIPIFTGGSAEISLKRAGTWANGFICGSSAIPEFPPPGRKSPSTREQPAGIRMRSKKPASLSWPSTTIRPKQ